VVGSMLHRVGRAFQVAALIGLPMAMVLQLQGAWTRNGEQSVSPLLLCLAAAVCLFVLGRLIEGYSRP
jgi:hypothetical protein